MESTAMRVRTNISAGDPPEIVETT